MRLNRILYGSLLMLAFLFVYFYGGKIPYMLFYTVLALPVVSFLLSAAGYFGFKYEQSLNNSSAVKGDKVTLKLQIVNRSLFILPYVSIQIFSGGLLSQESVIRNLSLQPFSKKEFFYDYVYKYRGCYELGVSGIVVQDFLGIFRLVRKNKMPLRVTVYPRLIIIDNMALVSRDLSEPISNLRNLHEDISTIEGIRKYNYGDSMSKIHWKLSAKMNELMIKEYQWKAAERTLFIVDLKRNPFTPDSNAFIGDKHIEAIVAVLRYYIHHGVAVRLVYHDEEIRSMDCNSPLDFENAYQTLAKVQFNQKVSFTDLIEGQIDYGINKPDILLSTSNLDDRLYETICRMKSVGYEISLVYISPEEIMGEKKPDTGQKLSVLPESGIKVYRINIRDEIKGVLEYGGR